MERLTIDEIIEHCGRKTGMYEKACDVKHLETAVMGNGIKEYWEHKQVAEYLRKLKEYEDLEEQGRLIKLPVKDDATGYRECVHIKSTCYHEDYKCSECPLTELLCDEFYEAIDRCYEEAYASGCLAGMELGKYKAEAELEELRGGENG
jgi:hypothetical protein